MTASGTWNFSITNGEAVIDAYERCGIFMPQLEQKHFYTARRQLNLMFTSEWSNKQVNLFAVVLNSQALTQGTPTYTLPANVVMILDAYRSTTTAGVQTDIFMTPISRDDYAAYPQKSTPGPPNQYWFNRQITPTVTTYPVADNAGPYTLNYYACISVQDANLPNGETPGIPNRWFDAMCSGLAWRVSKVYAPDKTASLKTDYDEAWRTAATQDIENVPIRIVPKMSGYYR